VTTFGVVTISFNQGRFLSEAIESVRLGDPSRLRYVIVDPGSSDGSRQVIETHRERFQSVILEPDRGPADGLNKGFAALDADILGYINADDRFTAGALDVVAEFFSSHPEVDVLLGAGRVIDETGRPRLRKALSTEFTLRGWLRGTVRAVQQATFFRRRAWEKTTGFNGENRTCWDAELLVDMALAGARFQTIDRVFGDFRIYPSSITGSGRFAAQIQRDVERIRAKIVQSGIKAVPRWEAKFCQLCLSADPVFQIRRLIVS
jgi:glycosyltransferase involved in cell wall biosynthesis